MNKQRITVEHVVSMRGAGGIELPRLAISASHSNATYVTDLPPSKRGEVTKVEGACEWATCRSLLFEASGEVIGSMGLIRV